MVTKRKLLNGFHGDSVFWKGVMWRDERAFLPVDMKRSRTHKATSQPIGDRELEVIYGQNMTDQIKVYKEVVL